MRLSVAHWTRTTAWVIISSLMPWEELEATYVPHSDQPLAPLQSLWGWRLALFIKQRLGSVSTQRCAYCFLEAILLGAFRT